MAVIQDLVLTFCPTIHSVQQKKLKLLMPVLKVSYYLNINSSLDSYLANGQMARNKVRVKGIEILSYPLTLFTPNLGMHTNGS